MTAEELFWHRDADHRFELVRGELRLAPFAYMDEARVSARIAYSRAVIVIAPRPEMVSVHRAEGSKSVFGTLEVDDVFPGWKIPLEEIFQA